MAGHRIDRINDEMRREMAAVLMTVKDPRINGQLVSVTGCEVTADLKFAKIFYSVYPADDDNIKQAKSGFESSKGYIRREISSRLNLRHTPELNFIFDNSAVTGAKINKILKDLGNK